MDNDLSITSRYRNNSRLRFVVGLHFSIGMLLMWLEPLASLFGEQAGQIIGLRVTHPLLPFLGLFWMLVAVALVSGRRFVIKGAVVAHSAALLLPIAGIVLGMILLLPPEPRGHMARSPAPVAFLLMLLSVVVATFAVVCIFSLSQLLRQPDPAKPLWSRQTRFLALSAVLLFTLRLFL